MKTEKPQESSYRIGAVARMTGVSVDTLRIWERRYQVVSPQRSEGGSRLYGEGDVERLVLIKRLVDSGHAIGTVAGLTLEQLKARAGGQDVDAAPGRDGPPSIVIVGTTLPFKLVASRNRDDNVDDKIEIAGTFEDLAGYEAVANQTEADALVVEVPVVIEDTVAQLRRLQLLGYARRVIAVYDYGKSRSIRQLQNLGVVPLRYPVSWSELARLFVTELRYPLVAVDMLEQAIDAREPAPLRRFDDRQLSLISSRGSSVECECQRHLADLVVSLTRFESYSVECENRSQEDAVLHSYVHIATAHARALLESALNKLIEKDGIPAAFDERDDGI